MNAFAPATRQAEISNRGPGVPRAGACWRDAGVARRAGQVALTLRDAGCRGLRKVVGERWRENVRAGGDGGWRLRARCLGGDEQGGGEGRQRD